MAIIKKRIIIVTFIKLKDDCNLKAKDQQSLKFKCWWGGFYHKILTQKTTAYYINWKNTSRETMTNKKHITLFWDKTICHLVKYHRKL